MCNTVSSSRGLEAETGGGAGRGRGPGGGDAWKLRPASSVLAAVSKRDSISNEVEIEGQHPRLTCALYITQIPQKLKNRVFKFYFILFRGSIISPKLSSKEMEKPGIDLRPLSPKLQCFSLNE